MGERGADTRGKVIREELARDTELVRKVGRVGAGFDFDRSCWTLRRDVLGLDSDRACCTFRR